MDYSFIEKLEIQMEMIEPNSDNYHDQVARYQRIIDDYLWEHRVQRGYYDDQWKL